MFFGAFPEKIRRPTFLILLLLIVCLFFSAQSIALAKPAANLYSDYSAPSVPSTALGFIYTLFRLVFYLILVIGLFYASVFLYKKFSWSNLSAKPASEGTAKTIGSVSLGGGRFVHLVQIAERVIVLGSADGGVNLLLELDPLEAKEMVELYESKGLASVEPFEATLFRLYSGWQKPIVDKSKSLSKTVINDLKDRMETWKQRTVRK